MNITRQPTTFPTNQRPTAVPLSNTEHSGLAAVASLRISLCVLTSCFLLSSCAITGASILSDYQSMMGAGGGRRWAPHAGVDFGALGGGPVLAAADGEVAYVSERPTGCGTGVLIAHWKFSRFTVYCHLEKYVVHIRQRVKRGEIIGYMGTTGNAFGITHVHLELCTSFCPRGHTDGNLQFTEDPLAISAGCFDPQKNYPADRLVLTFPVKCKSKN